MPVRATPESATTKWTQRLSGATADITAGVQNVQKAPGAAAAAKVQKWQTAVAASTDKWKRNVSAVSLTDWQQSMISIGIPRVAQGAQAKQGKYTAFAQQFFPYLAQGIAKVEAMPDTTQEERINRAVTMMRHNAGFKRGG